MLWFYCDDETGQIVTGGGSADPEEGKLQAEHTPEGMSFFQVPNGSILNPYSPSPDLSPLRTMLAATIDHTAEDLRLLYITPGHGQALEYMQKISEVGQFASNPNAYVPMIEAEAEALGVEKSVVVASISDAYSQWLAIGARINAVRRKAKADMDAATTLPALIAASDTNWQFALTGEQPATPPADPPAEEPQP